MEEKESLLAATSETALVPASFPASEYFVITEVIVNKLAPNSPVFSAEEGSPFWYRTRFLQRLFFCLLTLGLAIVLSVCIYYAIRYPDDPTTKQLQSITDQCFGGFMIIGFLFSIHADWHQKDRILAGTKGITFILSTSLFVLNETYVKLPMGTYDILVRAILGSLTLLSWIVTIAVSIYVNWYRTRDSRHHNIV